MNHPYVDRLNTQLADAFGRTLAGRPKYKWAHTSELRLPYLNEDGVVTEERQCDDDYWTIAVWQQPTPGEWLAVYGTRVPLPSDGVYYASDVRLPSGVEPSEATTQKVMATIRYRDRNLRTMRDALAYVNDAADRREAEARERAEDFVRECMVYGTWVPGAADLLVPAGTQKSPAAESPAEVTP